MKIGMTNRNIFVDEYNAVHLRNPYEMKHNGQEYKKVEDKWYRKMYFPFSTSEWRSIGDKNHIKELAKIKILDEL